MGASRKLVYTVITRDYDTLRPIRREIGFDYLCFTDNPRLKRNGWDLEILDKADNPVRQQRIIKICSHIQGYPLTVYMDANFQFYRPISELMQRHYQGGFLTCLHDARTLITEEIDRILELRKDTPENMDKVRFLINRNNIPDDCGMYANGFIIRDYSDAIIELEKNWANLLMLSSHRDQLTLGAASYLTGTKINTMTRQELRHYSILQAHKRHEDILFKPV